MNTTPILSICIPIFNRLAYLERMLERFLEDKDLFENDIHLFISDNCSKDDLNACCNKYQALGLNINYHRNEENIGPDRNFELCFNSGVGKYTWLLGSDDIPVRGYLRKLVAQLDKNDYGLFYLSMSPQNSELIEFTNSGDMAVAERYWITFMSANIIKTDSIKGVELSAYRKSNLIQVPIYLNACLTSEVNAISYLGHPFEVDTDSANNGGYNLFRVFVVNLYGIYETFIQKGLLNKQSYKRLKKVEFKEFLSPFIVELLILRRNKNFDTKDAWSILFKYYGCCFYAYQYIFTILLKSAVRKIVKPIFSVLTRSRI